MASLDVREVRDLPTRALPRAWPSWSSHRVELRLAVTIFVLVCILCMLATYLGQHSKGVATIWLSNGLLFAILIRQPRSTWPAYLLVGYCADALGASLMNNETILSSVVVSACNTLEIALAATVLSYRLGLPLKLSRPRPLFAFFGIGVLLAPAIACALASLCLTLVDHAAWVATYRTWFLGDALGMAIVAPLIYTVQEPAFFTLFRPRQLPQTLLILAVPAFATFVDFSQDKEPFPLLIMPALIFVTFRRGFPGVVVGLFLATCIAISITVGGHGLMTLSRTSNLLHHVVGVQLFITVTIFSIFPIAALLEESQALALSLKQSEASYMELANTDALTGQANRRAFEQRLDAEWQRAVELHRPLALLTLDIDHFKAYNDLYGHIKGDDCLRQVAALAAGALHQTTSARLYRVGGEEFAVILPEATLAETHTVAESIRSSVFFADIEHRANPLGRNTVSVGLVTAIPLPSQTALSLIARSDQALYAAKHNGRNRCEAAS